MVTTATVAGLAATSANLTTIAALSGTSGFMPQLQDLFDAKERALAYDEGANLIEKAQVRDFGALATKSAEWDPKATAPCAAAVNLFYSTVAALNVVESVLVSHLPSVDDLKRASGEYAQVDLVPEIFAIDPGSKTTAYITGTAPFSSVTIRDPAVASVVLNGRAIEITAGTTGGTSTQLVMTAVSGALHGVPVLVKMPAPVPSAPTVPTAPTAPAAAGTDARG